MLHTSSFDRRLTFFGLIKCIYKMEIKRSCQRLSNVSINIMTLFQLSVLRTKRIQWVRLRTLNAEILNTPDEFSSADFYDKVILNIFDFQSKVLSVYLMAHASNPEKTISTEEDEDDDIVERMLKKTGCLEKHYSVQECIAETKDWRQCQQQVADFRTCMETHKKKTSTS